MSKQWQCQGVGSVDPGTMETSGTWGKMGELPGRKSEVRPVSWVVDSATMHSEEELSRETA